MQSYAEHNTATVILSVCPS